MALGDDFLVCDKRFRMLIQGNGWVERLHTGSRWAEGPVWFADSQTVVWSDIPNDRLLQFLNIVVLLPALEAHL